MIIVSSLFLCAWLVRPTYFTNIAGNNEVYSVPTKVSDSAYDIETQEKVASEIETLKSKNTYTESSMLLIHNPYGTNTQSMYVYFTTVTPMNVSYTIHVDDETIPDFTNTLPTKDSYSTQHEYQLLGLIPDMENTITFHLVDKDGIKTDVSYEYNMGSLLGSEEILLEKEEGTSTQEVSEGLYVILGNDSTEKDFMYYYDNNGVLRGEVPIANYRSHRLLFNDNNMYFSYDTNKIAEMNNLGQITNIFDLGTYDLHHDYVFDDNDNILILASDTTANTVEDMVIRLNISTKEINLVADLGTLFPTYKEECTSYVSEDMDWMHINTIQSMGNGEILLSSRETSTIIKLSNIYDTPTVDYMMGERTFWDSTDYANLLLSKDGSFTSQAGQHSITYVEDDSLEDGQYYLYIN